LARQTDTFQTAETCSQSLKSKPLFILYSSFFLQFLAYLKSEKLETGFTNYAASKLLNEEGITNARWPTNDEIYAATQDAISGNNAEDGANKENEIPKTPEGNKARAARDTANAEVNKLEGELRKLKEDESNDFGPDSVFYRLKGKCFSYRSTQYTYEVCPFGTAKQDHTSLGTFTSWGKTKAADGTEVNDYSYMQFSNGAYCWNGPNRSMKVKFECGEKEELLNPDEPEKCTYSSVLQTPAACDAKFARELKLELEDVGAE
jgi:Glucosidase II beta subunit-like protein